MARTKRIEHQGKSITWLDLSGLNSTDVAPSLAAIREAAEVIRAQPRGSVRTLTDVSGSAAPTQVMDALKAMVRDNKPYVKAAAVVGLSPLQRMLARAVAAFSGRTLQTFDAVDQAKDWLATQ